MTVWAREPLGKHADIRARIGWRGLSSAEYQREGPLLIAGQHINNGRVTWDQCDPVSDKRYEESHEIALRAGDVIISKDGTIGRVARIDDLPSQATLNGTMMLVRPKKSLDYRFLYHFLGGRAFQKLIEDKVSGSSIPHLFQRDMVGLNIDLPQKCEQSRIAEVLDTIDEAIANRRAVIAKLKRLRAGLLHDLLTRGLDEHGQLRDPVAHPEQFQDSPLGRIPKEWAVEELKDCYAIPSRNGLYKKATHYGSGHRMVHMPQMFGSMLLEVSNAVRVEVEPEELQRCALLEGDVLFARRSLNLEGAGLCSLVPPVEEPVTFESSIIRVRLDKTRIIPRFAAEFLRSEFGYLLRRAFIRQVAVSGVSSEDVGRFLIPQPTLAEQHQLLANLEAYDCALSTYKAELAKIVQLKSGLMNDLLTGRVRVPEGIAVGE
jgi:type I restriction enzyme, S subunit